MEYWYHGTTTAATITAAGDVATLSGVETEVTAHEAKSARDVYDIISGNAAAGDVNYDKKVDIKDILKINRYRLGKISNL